jgi:NAD(P)-dependent dehydrogenase (short-subunit alcohol dehydrogenase family)
MELHLEGKSVLITGGSKGIGLACASLFATEGCDVHIVGRSSGALDAARRQVEKETGRMLTAHCADVAQAQERETLAAILENTDILVNCAGAIPGGSLDDISLERWRWGWELKVYGYIEMTRMALANMRERGAGVIVNVIGIGGAEPRYNYICGSAGNAALISFTRAVGAETARIGVEPDSSGRRGNPAERGSRVRVVGVNPGPTDTERMISVYRGRAQSQLGDGDRWRELLSDLPFGCPSTAEEIADIVAFLASDRASYLTGVVIDADGGAMYR